MPEIWTRGFGVEGEDAIHSVATTVPSNSFSTKHFLLNSFVFALSFSFSSLSLTFLDRIDVMQKQKQKQNHASLVKLQTRRKMYQNIFYFLPPIFVDVTFFPFLHSPFSSHLIQLGFNWRSRLQTKMTRIKQEGARHRGNGSARDLALLSVRILFRDIFE